MVKAVPSREENGRFTRRAQPRAAAPCDVQRGPRCWRSGEWKHTLKTHASFSVHFLKFRSTPQVWTAAVALRLGAAALSSCSVYIIAAGRLLGSSQDIHNLAHFLVCVRDLSCMAKPVALTRVGLTARLDLRSSRSWLVFFFVGGCCSQCYYCIQVCFDCPKSAVSLFAHHRELVAEDFGHHFVEFCLSRGPVAGRRHHCIRVPFDPPRLLDCACRTFCSGERRIFLSLRRRSHLVSDVDACVSPW